MRARLISAALLLALALPGQAAEVFYIHTDHAGSVVMETDQQRNITWQGQYEPYGLPTQTTPEGPGYTGHVHDAASGLVYMQQRYYDPQLGRFLSVDPMAVDGGTAWNFNRYNYAANNPYRYTDPDGEAIHLLIGAAIGGGVELVSQVFIEKKSLSEVDLSDVGIAMVAGALTGGIAASSAMSAARGSISVGRAVAQTSTGAGATQVNASLAGDIANGTAMDIGAALVSGTAAAAGAGAGQAFTLAPRVAMNQAAKSGGIGAHIVESTLRGVDSDAAFAAVSMSTVGQNIATGLDVAGSIGLSKLQAAKEDLK